MLDEKMTLAVQLKKSKDEHQKEVNLLKPVSQIMQEENEQVFLLLLLNVSASS
jgi:hypothetical protein